MFTYRTPPDRSTLGGETLGQVHIVLPWPDHCPAPCCRSCGCAEQGPTLAFVGTLSGAQQRGGRVHLG